MPTRLKRYYGRDHLHFLTCSCYHRQPWLAQPRRRDLFLEILEQVRQRYRFVVVGYVIMPEHIHLLISEPERGTPSTIMQVVSSSNVSPAASCAANAATPRNANSGRTRHTYGNIASTTSTSGASASASRNSATCTATL